MSLRVVQAIERTRDAVDELAGLRELLAQRRELGAVRRLPVAGSNEIARSRLRELRDAAQPRQGGRRDPALPTRDSNRLHAELVGELFLRQSCGASRGAEATADAIGLVAHGPPFLSQCERATRQERRRAARGDDTGVQSLKGQLLIAGPGLIDPNFRRAVVLVGEHGEEGAMGVVLNRPSGATITEAVPDLATLVAGSDVVHVGGPVQPSAIVVLADFDEPDRAGSLVLGSVGFLPADVEPEELGELKQARVFAGYAGWGPRQLDVELEEGSWIVEPALPEDVFTTSPEELWSVVLRRKGGPFSVLALMPPDPSLN